MLHRFVDNVLLIRVGTERNDSTIMNCFYHPTRGAVATCGSCNKGLCQSCVQTEKDVDAYSAMSYCPEHASGVRDRVAIHNTCALFFGVMAGGFILIYVLPLLFGWSSAVMYIATVLFVVLVTVGVFIRGIMKVRKIRCPVCGTFVPQARIPKNINQALMGGWTCSTCGAEMDRNGHLVGRRS